MVVATDTAHRHVETWMKRHTPEGSHAIVTDVTGAYSQINIQGPKSRELMQALTSADMSNDGFPFRSVQDIDIGCVVCGWWGGRVCWRGCAAC